MNSSRTNFYKINPGEPQKQAREKWVYRLIHALARQMNIKAQPTAEYVSAALRVLTYFPDNIVWTFFQEAPGEYKYLPKPAEIKDSCKELNRIINKPDQSRKIAEPAYVTEKHPWPNSVIGLIMGLDDFRGLSPFGLGHLGITKDEAVYLHMVWKKCEWDDVWAKEIIAKSRPFKFRGLGAEPAQGEIHGDR